MNEAKSEQLDFLIVAPTPFFANRGCHMRIRGEAEALKRCDQKILILTYKEGKNIEGLEIERSFFSFGKAKKGVNATWKNLPAGFFLFWLALQQTFYLKPRFLYVHLFEGGAIGFLVKYFVWVLSYFQYRPCLVLDIQGSLAGEMKTYGMLKNPFFLWLAQKMENFILFFPDFIFVSSKQYANKIKQERNFNDKRIRPLADAISLFNWRQDRKTVRTGRNQWEKNRHLNLIKNVFSLEQIKQIRSWINQEKIIIIYTGDYASAKGFPFFLQKIWPSLLKNDDLRFLFGGGIITSVVQSTVLLAKNHDKFVSLNNLDIDTLPYFLLLGDIAIDPKFQETTESSGKILNYMATGLPVVCFERVNNRFFLQNNGYYAQSEKDFIELINQLANDPKKRKKLGINNLKMAWNKFTWDKVARKITKELKIFKF